MLVEMTAEELDADCRRYVALRCDEMMRAKQLLMYKYKDVREDEAGYIRIYDEIAPEDAMTYLYNSGIVITELMTDKIGLEEYYIDLMKGGSARE